MIAEYKNLRVVLLQAENIKKITAIEIVPDPNFVEITGKNGQGKTSALDCLWWAIEGAKHIQAVPIRKGATEARIRLDLGQLIVTRTFQVVDGGEITTKLTITNAEGTLLKKPQDILDKLKGALSFDPLEFTRLKPEEQFNILAKFVIDVDFKVIATDNKKDYDTRTDVNRRMKEARVAASQMVVTVDEFVNPIDETDLVNQMEEAGKENAKIEVARTNRANKANKVRQLEQELASLEIKINDLNVEIKTLHNELGSTTDKQLIDISILKQKISEARDTNHQIAAREEREAYEQVAKTLEEESKELTAGMEKREADKQAKIAAANLPVKGISFGDNQLLLDGVPFEQGSYSEQLRASLAIAMALNPQLRVIRLDEASSLDADSLKLVYDMAKSNNFQVWLSRTDSSGTVGVVMEAGHIKGQEHKAPEKIKPNNMVAEPPEDF